MNQEHGLGGINHNRFFARILTWDQKDNLFGIGLGYISMPS